MMDQLLVVGGIAVVLFASTNIDDIFILLSFFADPDIRPSRVVAGQFLGMLVLIAVSIAGSLLAVIVAPAHVGLLGIAPLVIGVVKLVRLRRPEAPEEQTPHPAGAAAQIGAVALVTFANGGDNLAIYIPVFSGRSLGELVVFAIIFLLLTAAWCAAGYALVNHPNAGAPIRRYARPLTPFILIALGLYILIESKAYTVFSGIAARALAPSLS
jgi:cadmium resistance protein CadD (predicted permease)